MNLHHPLPDRCPILVVSSCLLDFCLIGAYHWPIRKHICVCVTVIVPLMGTGICLEIFTKQRFFIVILTSILFGTCFWGLIICMQSIRSSSFHCNEPHFIVFLPGKKLLSLCSLSPSLKTFLQNPWTHWVNNS